MVDFKEPISPFVIKKETMIVKNKLPIDQVYKREKKVRAGGLPHCRRSEKAPTVTFLCVSIETLARKGPARRLRVRKSRIGKDSRPRSKFS